MQFEKEEYMEIKAEVEKWIINQFRDNWK
jgi:hypothetical protein